MGLTYRKSGVDIDKGDRFVDVVRSKLGAEEKTNIGLFGGLYDLASLEMEEPVLVASTDGVGTKLMLARRAGKYNTIGIDLVAMCVNDIVVIGAKPLFFLDYMATSDLRIDSASAVIDGILAGCREAGCALIGGETAEMPGMYKKGEYELAGFAVGAVEKGRVLDGTGVAKGDVLMGLGSSGIHSNGLSLARRAVEQGEADYDRQYPELGRTLLEELLEPTKIYVNTALHVLDSVDVKAIAHITGGGMEGNITRVLGKVLRPRIHWDKIAVPPVFDIIRDAGGIGIKEMRRTFNMGIGLVFVVREKDAVSLERAIEETGDKALMIGIVEAGD